MMAIAHVATGSKVDHSTAELVAGSMEAKLFQFEGRETGGDLTQEQLIARLAATLTVGG